MKADADVPIATVACVRLVRQGSFISFGYQLLGRVRVNLDPDIQKRVNRLLTEHEKKFCVQHHNDLGYWDRTAGETAVPLNHKVRIFGNTKRIWEIGSSIKNVMSFQMRTSRLSNSGALRVKQTILPSPITRCQLAELLFYDGELVRAGLTEAKLDVVLGKLTED